jgi:flagellar basal-body rod protein FlgG
MIRGFYTAVSGLIANATRQSVVADNIANVNTPGFRQSRTAQSDFELELVRSTGGPLGPLATAAIPQGPAFDEAAGPIETTGIPTDLAIEGDGLFVVRAAGGTAYTRAGNFVIDAAGTLTTQVGEPVLGADGNPIVIPGGASAFGVGPDGTVSGTTQRIALVPVPATGVERLGGNLLAIPGGVPAGAASGRIMQGAIEHSNVDLATAMTELIGFQRSLALDARSLRIQDETLAEAVMLGRLR